MALRGLKGGGYMTYKAMEQAGLSNADVNAMTPNEQQGLIGGGLLDGIPQSGMPDDPAERAKEQANVDLVSAWTPEETIGHYTYYSKTTQDKVYHVEDSNRKIWRGEPLTPSDVIKLNKLDEGLSKLTAHTGTVHRYMGFKTPGGIDAFIAGLKPGGVMSTKGVWSTSKSESTAKGFANISYFKGADGVVMKIHAKGKHGRDLSGKSKVPSESEVLFQHRSRFRVKNVSPWKGMNPAIKYYVELEEV